MFRIILLALLIASCTKPTEEICGVVGSRKLMDHYDMGGKIQHCKIWIDDQMVAVDCDTMKSVFVGDVVCVEGYYDSFY